MAKAKTSPFQRRYAGWGPILMALKRGEHPDAATLAAKLKTMEVDGLPELVKQHIIALLNGSVPKKRGRRRQDGFKDLAVVVAVNSAYIKYFEEFLEKKPEGQTANDAALAATAESFRHGVEWVKDRIYPNRLLRSK